MENSLRNVAKEICTFQNFFQAKNFYLENSSLLLNLVSMADFGRRGECSRGGGGGKGEHWSNCSFFRRRTTSGVSAKVIFSDCESRIFCLQHFPPDLTC